MGGGGGGGGGEIPKGGRAERSRFLGIWPRGGGKEIPRDLALGEAEITGGGEIPGTPVIEVRIPHENSCLQAWNHPVQVNNMHHMSRNLGTRACGYF